MARPLAFISGRLILYGGRRDCPINHEYLRYNLSQCFANAISKDRWWYNSTPFLSNYVQSRAGTKGIKSFDRMKFLGLCKPNFWFDMFDLPILYHWFNSIGSVIYLYTDAVFFFNSTIRTKFWWDKKVSCKYHARNHIENALWRKHTSASICQTTLCAQRLDKRNAR